MPKELDLIGACYPGRRKLFVNTNGEFYMCEKFGDRLNLGNVNSGLDESLILESIDEFTRILNENCGGNCWTQRLCTPCIQSAKDPKKDISIDGLKQKCDESNNQTIIGLALYVNLMKRNNYILKNYFKNSKGV